MVTNKDRRNELIELCHCKGLTNETIGEIFHVPPEQVTGIIRDSEEQQELINMEVPLNP